jgi:hypothetical protein
MRLIRLPFFYAVITRLVHNRALGRVIQYSGDGGA